MRSSDSNQPDWWPRLVGGTLLFGCVCSPVIGRELDSRHPPQIASPAQRLLIEQVEQSINAEATDEALLSLERLFDQAGDAVIETGQVQQAGTLSIQRYQPVRGWVKHRLLRLLSDNPELRQAYWERTREASRQALAAAAESQEVAVAMLAADRFYATEAGPDLCLTLADLYLERGWSLAALQVAADVSPNLRLELPAGQGSLAWSQVWAPSEVALERFRSDLQMPHALVSDREELFLAALSRACQAHAIAPDLLNGNAFRAWATAIAPTLTPPRQQQLQEIISAWEPSGFLPARDVTTFAGNRARNPVVSQRVIVGETPAWSHPLEGYTASSDQLPASRPRVGELDTGALGYFPAVVDGRVMINMLTEIRSYELATGRAWPPVRPAIPLFDSGIAPAAFMPLGYPLVGLPRGTLTVAEQCLYARMGQAITGWANDEVAGDGGSQSYLIGLDLRKQGRQLPGFPLRLMPPEFDGVEFEGAPSVVGDLLLAVLVERDDVGLRRSVAAFDRFSGRLRWRSATLADGTMEGIERANLISHQLLSYGGGRVYFSSNLGVVACLDVLTGATCWLTRYARVDKQQQAYPQPDRFRYRDLTPCVLSQGMVFCAPQDCPEIFALDACTGDLVWSTDAAQSSDLVHLLGVHDGHLIASGDRVAWFDGSSGKLLGRYPGATTPGRINALPHPRGLGRGVIAGGEVYWPVEKRLLVFPASLPDSTQGALARVMAPLRKIELGERAREGGNLIVHDDWLLYLAPRRISAYALQPAPSLGMQRR